MTKTVVVDGRKVPLRSSAAIPRLYRIKFHRDIIQDMAAIQRAVEKSRAENPDGTASTIPPDALELLENIAYLMAKHADPQVPGTADEWLDGFEMFSIYAVFPAIQELWDDNIRQLSVPAKK